MKKRYTKIVSALIVMFAICVIPVVSAQNKTELIIEKKAVEKEYNEENIHITKEITKMDKELGAVEVTVKIENKEAKQVENKHVEIWFVLDNSPSMNTKTTSGESRKALVTSSSKELVNKLFAGYSNVKVGIIKFSGASSSLSDAEIIKNLTNNKDELLSSIDSYNNGHTTNGTNIDAGLTKAINSFTEDAQKKIIILITDGIPTSAIEISNGNDITTENGVRVQNKMIETINSMSSDNIMLISLMTGLNPTDASYENDQAAIENMYGTEANPRSGKFYNISDADVSTIVSNNIFNDVAEVLNIPKKSVLIEDYFEEETLKDFNLELLTYNKGTASYDEEENKISLNIDEFNPEDEIVFTYTLKSKDLSNKDIIKNLYRTNKKITISYNDENDEQHTINVEESPTVKFLEKEDINPKTGDGLKLNAIDIIIIGAILLLVGLISYIEISEKKKNKNK